MRLFSCTLACTLLLVTSAAGQTTSIDSFDIAAPAASAAADMKLYATRYYVHYVEQTSGSASVSLLDRQGKSLGVSVSKSDFCFGALQGTISVKDGDGIAVYNVNSLAPTRSATCFYRKLGPATNSRLGRQAWAKLTGNGNYGLGVQHMRLVPFRTIAVDPARIPIGTVLYIPRLKGFEFSVDGQPRVHDGYVIAGDVGGAIKDNHIDFFTGNYRGPPPSFVTSDKKGLFDARVVTDAAIINRLKSDAKYKP